jgi:hypothetical protein
MLRQNNSRVIIHNNDHSSTLNRVSDEPFSDQATAATPLTALLYPNYQPDDSRTEQQSVHINRDKSALTIHTKTVSTLSLLISSPR